ncbi:MAG: hypothetical protein EOP53_21230 [Sphingobacteriales bacterium]|nr:MAG: hypothetical protein EOP53_21230 [Sphingobacteriales bacterium]
MYDVDSVTNKVRNVLSGRKDSLEVYQVSVRPYFKLQRKFGAKRMVTLEADVNWHWIKSATISNHLILPSISISEKRLLSRNRSLTTGASFYFQKPSDEYFKTVQIASDPSTRQTGSHFLKASKNIELETEYILERKFIISQKISANYGFDQLNFFSHYDSVAGNIKAISNNEAEIFSVNYEAGINRSFRERFVMSLTSEAGFTSSRHKLARAAYQDFTFGITSNFSYNLKKNKTTLGFLSITRTDIISAGGRVPGLNKYTFYCTRRLLKNYLIISFSASNFFQKGRTFRNVFLSNGEKILSSTVMPVRLFSFRVAYRMSDIRNAMAKRRSTYIQNESTP